MPPPRASLGDAILGVFHQIARDPGHTGTVVMLDGVFTITFTPHTHDEAAALQELASVITLAHAKPEGGKPS